MICISLSKLGLYFYRPESEALFDVSVLFKIAFIDL